MSEKTAMSALVDQEARDRIKNDLDTTLIVEAAAGTGKTTALIGRILSLLRSGRGRLSRLAAVTFTEKAAGEMKLRLRSEIDKARHEEELSAEEQGHLDRALEELEVCRIGTIHSFCSDILRERPLEAAVDPAFEMLPEEEATQMVDKELERWFEQALSAPPPGLRRYLAWRKWKQQEGPLYSLRFAAKSLVEHRDHPTPWEVPVYDREGDIASILNQVDSLVALGRRVSNPKNTLAKNLSALGAWREQLASREAVSARDLSDIERRLFELNDKKHFTWKHKGSGKEFAKGLLRQDVLAQRDELKESIASFLQNAEADLAAQLFEALWPIVERYEAAKAKRGTLDFLDLLLEARNLLRDSSEVRVELQNRFDQLFVDEFQDTDPLQAEIALLLSADDPTVWDPGSVKVVPGKLFVVGDPKQAIYRFRRADIAVYERVKTQLLAGGASLLHLQTNFRSRPEIQKAVNVSFAKHMVEATGTQAAYVPLVEHRQQNKKQPSMVALSIPEPFGYRGITSKAVSESTPKAVGAFVHWLLTESGWTVEDPETGQEVAVDSGHICLLFRNLVSFGRDTTRPYVRELESRRVPHVLMGGKSFYEREEVIALRSVLDAIERPEEELSVYASLRGPFMGLSDDALFAFRDDVGRIHPLRPLDDEQRGRHEDVAIALGLLGDLHRLRNRRTIAQTISTFLDSTHAHASVAIWPTGEQALANIYRIMEDARGYELRTATSFRSFVDWLDDKFEKGVGSQAPVVEEGSQGVRIMTAHKSKGLEFPVVILCDPTCPREKVYPSRYVDTDRQLWVQSLALCTPAVLREHEEAVLAADNAEEVRVVYVAATRARDLLVVPCVGEDTAKGWVDVLHSGLYPEPKMKRTSKPGPGCPEFGHDTVLRSGNAPMDSSAAVCPGLHALGDDGQVVWWDPSVLDLNPPIAGGVRQRDLLIEDEDGVAEESLREFNKWQAGRGAAIEGGAAASWTTQTVTQAAAAGTEGLPAIEVVEALRDKASRPGGRRFGTLIHGVLGDLPFADDGDKLPGLIALHSRTVGASDEEKNAAESVVQAALAHPLMVRAKAAASRGECYQELPLVMEQEGTVLEGVADLVFREEGKWTVVDYKTDADPSKAQSYSRQVGLYVRMLERATGEPAQGLLLAL